MRKVVVMALVAVFASASLALATWKVVDLVKGGGASDGAASGGATSAMDSPEAAANPTGEGGAAEANTGGGEASAAGVEAAGLPSGEDFSHDTPTQRYVTETQRHQNFFIALAEGRVKRLDAVATDYQPAGDANASYLYFTVTTTDGRKHNGTMVLRYDGGLWRIAAIRQLTGELAGGTDYVVPANFEDDLARELSELQEFLTKVAQGRLDYMVVDNVNRPTDTLTILTGRVVGIGGRVENTRMTLRKDYNVWHLTNIESVK